jgi:hypothetical protein
MPERRQHPRIDLAAQVEVSASEVMHLLRAVNASRGGIFLEGAPKNYPHFVEGLEVAVHICEIEGSAVESEQEVDVEARARIVRIEAAEGEQGGGFALEFVSLDEDNQARLDALLDRAGT